MRKFIGRKILIEDTGVGTALVAELKDAGLYAIAVEPERDKVTRMSIQSGKFESGQILLPNKAPWLADLESELFALSRNQAAVRFKVSVASAVRWVKRFKTTGEISPAPCGGDRRSGRDAFASRLSLGPDPAQPGPHAARDPGTADRQLRRALCGLRAVAFHRLKRASIVLGKETLD